MAAVIRMGQGVTPSFLGFPGANDGSYLAPDLKVRGRIVSSGAVTIDGILTGDVQAQTVTVGRHGRVKAKIDADNTMVSGAMVGVITTRQAVFTDGAHFEGDVQYEAIGVEANANLQAAFIPVVHSLAGERAERVIHTVESEPVMAPLPSRASSSEPQESEQTTPTPASGGFSGLSQVALVLFLVVLFFGGYRLFGVMPPGQLFQPSSSASVPVASSVSEAASVPVQNEAVQAGASSPVVVTPGTLARSLIAPPLAVVLVSKPAIPQGTETVVAAPPVVPSVVAPTPVVAPSVAAAPVAETVPVTAAPVAQAAVPPTPVPQDPVVPSAVAKVEEGKSPAVASSSPVSSPVAGAHGSAPAASSPMVASEAAPAKKARSVQRQALATEGSEAVEAPARRKAEETCSWVLQCNADKSQCVSVRQCSGGN